MLDLCEELDAENYTMRIAATRSSRLYGLEGSNPKLEVVFEGFESRSTEVDRGRSGRLRSTEVATVFGPFLDAQKLAEAQNRTTLNIFSCSTPWKWSQGSAPEKILIFGAGQGSNLADVPRDDFCHDSTVQQPPLSQMHFVKKKPAQLFLTKCV